jgi:hypothetical protein
VLRVANLLTWRSAQRCHEFQPHLRAGAKIQSAPKRHVLVAVSGWRSGERVGRPNGDGICAANGKGYGDVIASAVIDRELRIAARQPFTYWLRAAGVAALLVICGYAILTRTSEVKGAEFFSFIHLGLFLAIWIMVPLLTADCISSERREETLPLLFLTRLKPGQIVAAKGVAQSLRALTLWGAALPVAAIAFLIGGVTWKEAVISACINLSSILFA